jgi:hypothetical protein
MGVRFRQKPLKASHAAAKVNELPSPAIYTENDSSGSALQFRWFVAVVVNQRSGMAEQGSQEQLADWSHPNDAIGKHVRVQLDTVSTDATKPDWSIFASFARIGAACERYIEPGINNQQ